MDKRSRAQRGRLRGQAVLTVETGGTGRTALRRVVPSGPYQTGEQAIVPEERRLTLAGLPPQPTATEYDLPTELTADGRRMLTHDDRHWQVLGPPSKGGTRAVHAIERWLRRHPGDDASGPVCFFSEPRVGYRMPKSGNS